jgi:hypothetical protein
MTSLALGILTIGRLRGMRICSYEFQGTSISEKAI